MRRQGGEGTCTGQALAAVIDILRLPLYPAPDTVPPASARMLFEMARSHAPDPSGRGEVHSLRAALKGFYHNGACLDDMLISGLVGACATRYRCIVPDHLGCGLSGQPREEDYAYTLDNRVADLEALIQDIEEARAEDEPFHGAAVR